MAPFFFSIHREHFIRACVSQCVFVCGGFFFRVRSPDCAPLKPYRCARARARRGARCLHNPLRCARAARSEMPGFGIRAGAPRPRALGRGIIFDALDSAQGEVKNS